MPSVARSAALGLTEVFLRRHPGEAAARLETLPTDEIVRLVERMPAPSAAVVERLTPQVGATVLARLSANAARQVLPGIDPGRVAALVSRLGEEERERLLASLDPAPARELRNLIDYPIDTAGQLMHTRTATIAPEATAGEALERLRQQRGPVLHNVYLVDQGGRLVGSVALQDLALARPELPLRELVRGEPLTVRAMTPREDVLEQLAGGRIGSVPVVDFDDRLLGVIRHDSLVTAVREQASIDIQKMVGAGGEERALSRASLSVRKRLPWLQVNLATAFLAAAVVALFENTIAQFTALAVLLPVVAGQSGNTGAQALAVTMRGLALREIRPRHWPRVALKEVKVALVNGVAVALTTSLGVWVWSRSAGLALVIAVSMVISMAAAGLSGASIPIALIKLRQDPAQASSIILTTVTDVVGFLSFLGIATLLASML